MAITTYQVEYVLERNYKDFTPNYRNGRQIGYKTAYDSDAINNALSNLFNISLGEVPGKPWLGNSLRLFLFENIQSYHKDVISEILLNIIENYEPRIDVQNITVDFDGNSIYVNIDYYIIYGLDDSLKTHRIVLNTNLSNIETRTIL